MLSNGIAPVAQFILGVLLLIFGLVFTTVGGYLTKDGWHKWHQKTVIPNISCSMKYPIKVEDDKVARNKRNPDVIITNNGPIKVVSVVCDIKVYVYN